MREPPVDETPQQRVQRQRAGSPVGERVAAVETRSDGFEDEIRHLRRAHERLEGRLWWLVTTAAGVGSAAGVGAATAWQALGGG